MPKIKLFISLGVIVMALALVGGATMAWFTSATDPIENVFTAGTVEIEAGYGGDFGKIITGNWNPGDCDQTEVCITNEGTKAVQIRAKFDGRWVPGSQRMLIIYKDGNTQLLSLDWDSFCLGCTGKEGYIAKGSLTISQHDGWPSYMKGIFNSFEEIKNEDWLQTNEDYYIWCVDSQTTINLTTHNDVYVYDPYCNSDWYKEDGVNAQDKWKNIPWYKLDYIINSYSVGEDDFTMDDIQDAIWSFTNPGNTVYNYLDQNDNNIEITVKAKEIVDDVLANSGLPEDTLNVTITTSGWTKESDGWWYYNDEIPGTFTETDEEPRKICLAMEVCLDGATTGNLYQGASYHLYTQFQAIQASHDPDSDSDVSWDWSEFDEYNQSII